LTIWAARRWSRRAEFRLYHTAHHLSRENIAQKQARKNPEISVIFFEKTLAIWGEVWYYNIVKRKGNKNPQEKK